MVKVISTHCVWLIAMSFSLFAEVGLACEKLWFLAHETGIQVFVWEYKPSMALIQTQYILHTGVVSPCWVTADNNIIELCMNSVYMHRLYI